MDLYTCAACAAIQPLGWTTEYPFCETCKPIAIQCKQSQQMLGAVILDVFGTERIGLEALAAAADMGFRVASVWRQKAEVLDLALVDAERELKEYHGSN